MSKLTLTGFVLPLFVLFASPEARSHSPAIHKSPDTQGQTGTLQKMIIENGSVTMDLDLNRLNGISAASGKLEQMRFLVAANSFFPILVFNDLLRGFEPGSMALVPQNIPTVPTALSASLKQLVIEKLPSGQGSGLAVRDSNSGFTFF